MYTGPGGGLYTGPGGEPYRSNWPTPGALLEHLAENGMKNILQILKAAGF
jgi:hypothetical protein